MPSPKNSAAPNTPSPISSRRDVPAPSLPRSARAVSARMPPSPRLSARMTKTTYFTVTTRISAQAISDRKPSTLAGVGVTPTWRTCPGRLMVSLTA